MATKRRLIDALEALRMIKDSRTDNPYFNGKTTPIWEMAHDCAISCVVACPPVDAVEVVRCKDCKLFTPFVEPYHRAGQCRKMAGLIDENCFCSYGERRTDV